MEKTTNPMDISGSRTIPLTLTFIEAANTIPLESPLPVNLSMDAPLIVTSMVQCYAMSRCLSSPWPFSNAHSIKKLNFILNRSELFPLYMTNPPPSLSNQINFDVAGSLPIMTQGPCSANALGRTFFSPTRGLNHHLVHASISRCFSPIISPERSSFCHPTGSFPINTDEYPNRSWNASSQQHSFPSGYFDSTNQAAFMEPQRTNYLHVPNMQFMRPLPNYEDVNGDCLSNGSPLIRQEMNTRYKCDLCSAEFPTGQAYGGHMSSHSKIRKADRAPGEPSKRSKKFKTIPWTPIIPNDGGKLNLHFLNESVEEKEKQSSRNVGSKSFIDKDAKEKIVIANLKEKGKSPIGEIPTKAPSYYMDDEFANSEATFASATSLRLH